MCLTFAWIYYLEKRRRTFGRAPPTRDEAMIQRYHSMLFSLALTDILDSATYLTAQFPHHSDAVCQYQALTMLFLDLSVIFWFARCAVIPLCAMCSRSSSLGRYACLAFELMVILVFSMGVKSWISEHRHKLYFALTWGAAAVIAGTSVAVRFGTTSCSSELQLETG